MSAFCSIFPFGCPPNLKTGLLKVIAESLSTEEIKGLKQMFNNMDTDDSGTITYEELRDGLSRLGSKLTETEIKQLMEAVRTLNYLISLSAYLLEQHVYKRLEPIYLNFKP